MLVKVADWITDHFEKMKAWVEERYGADTRQAEVATNVVIAAFAAAVIVAAVVLAWLVIALLVALTEGVAEGLIVSFAWGLERVADWHLTEVITTPVRAYITTHATGLPAGAEAIWSAWAVAGPGLWLICWLFRSWGARLAWILYGAATVAMVYNASPAGGQWLAAGLAVLYWGVLSVFAFRGVGRRAAVHIHPSPDVTTALQHLRQQMDKQLSELRARVDRVEEAALDELAARRTGGRDSEDF